VKSGRLVVEGEMKYDRSDCSNQHHNKSKHGGDKPSRTCCVPGAGLGNAEGIDKDVRQKEERSHGYWMIAEGARERLFVHPWDEKRILLEELAAMVACPSVE
jgi:hypothetical protein